jgi:N-acetylneuraminate lyase
MPTAPLKLRGLVAPPFTPLREDGSLDLPTIDRLADRFAEQGLAGAFVCGTSGEGPSLTVQERQQVLERWCAAAGGRFPVIAQVGHSSVTVARALAEHAARSGAAAISALPPFYHRPETVDDAVACCAHIAAGAPGLPFYYYHIPDLTHIRLPMAGILRAAEGRVPTFAGFKFSDGDFVDFGRCVSFGGDRYDFFFGRDEMLLAALALGARAAIGTTYNFAAPLYRAMITAVDRGDLKLAREAQATSRRLISIIQGFGGLPAMKAAMSIAGIPCGPCRLPLRTLDAAQREALAGALSQAALGDVMRPE